MMAQLRRSLARGSRRGASPASADGPASADETLIRWLYAEHGRVLLGYVTKLTGDRHSAEDVVQETLLRAWRNAGKLTDDQGSVRAWLLTVARNIVVDRVRARSSRPVEVAENPSAPPIAHDHAETVVTSVYVKHALQTLSPEHRAVLLTVYYGGKTATEAAEILQIPPGTVKSRLHHALRGLRRAVQDVRGEASA